MKSVTTLNVDPTVATATRSAGDIFSSTYLFAESTARWTSSGCIELTSKTIVISLRPASISDVIGVGASTGRAAVGDADAVRLLSSASFSSTPARSSADCSAGTALSVISSKLKLVIS